MSDYYKKNKKETGGSNFLWLLEKGVELLVSKLFSKNGFGVFPAGELEKRWREVEEMDPKYALVEADKLVDVVLKKAQIEGMSMADRIRKTEKLVPRQVYQDLWHAHKMRNEMVHEMDKYISEDESKNAIWKMKKYLISLGAFKNE